MSIQFNAAEILEMAEAVERNGAAFYRQAAEHQSNRQVREMLLKLAGMEEEHQRVFASMRAGLSEPERRPVTFDPYDETGLYLQAMADRAIFPLAPQGQTGLTGRETVEAVLGLAIQAEKDSIAFYVGLRELVPADRGRAQVDRIIKEEMGHFGTLSAALKEYLA